MKNLRIFRGAHSELSISKESSLPFLCEASHNKGALIQEDKSATLSCANDQTLFQPVCFGIGAASSGGMLSNNPHSGIYEASTARTLDANGGNPSCNQGGIAVVEPQGFDRYNQALTGAVTQTLNAAAGESGQNMPMVLEPASFGIDRAAYNQGRNASYNFSVDEEVEPTMVAKGPGAVAAPAYTSSRESFFTEAQEEVAHTLVATDYKGPPIVTEDSEPLYSTEADPHRMRKATGLSRLVVLWAWYGGTDRRGNRFLV